MEATGADSDLRGRDLLDRASHDRRCCRPAGRGAQHPRRPDEFLTEVEGIISRVAEHRESSPEELARLIHTVKGCATFDVASVATLCHELEDRAKESGALSDADRALLKAAWASFSERVGGMLGTGAGDGGIVIAPREYEAFLDQLVEGVPRSDLAREITRWRLDRVQPRLERLGDQAKLMAKRLGKDVDIEVEPTSVRVSAEESKRA